MKRRLIVFFDGTWNTPDSGKTPTNVVKMLRAVRNQSGGVSQICFYDKGVGTGGPVDRLLGGVSGKGLTDNMLDGYRFLANNADPEDEIYVFGFSRGAYTARSLVGFLNVAGLLSPLDLGAGLQEAIEVYRRRDLKPEEKQAKLDSLPITRCTGVKVRCIGVWDTVGSLGIPGDLGRRFATKYYFHDVQLGGNVEVALHAVAIDEKRSAFAPTLWVREKDAPAANDQIVEQVWFSGVHSNIGGSYPDAGLADIALDWMIKRVKDTTGLGFDQSYITKYIRANPLGDGVESRTALYKDCLIFPYQRLIHQIIPKGWKVGDWFRETFPTFDRRNIPPDNLVPINEAIHISALERWGKSVVHDGKRDRIYKPPNLAAAIRRGTGGFNLPVIDWGGQVLPRQNVQWPVVP